MVFLTLHISAACTRSANLMAITEPYELDGVTVGATELSIVSGTTTLQNVTDDGVYFLWVDANTMVKGDQFMVRVYEKVLSGSTKRVVWRHTISDLQSEILTFPPIWLLHGWDMTIQKVAGTDQTFDASIRAVTGSALTEYDTLSAVTVGATELSIVSGTTTLQTITDAGIYQLWVDTTNMAQGDVFTARIAEKVEGTGGTKRLVYLVTFTHVQDDPLFVSPALLLKNGWDMTLQKIAGTDRAFDASIRRVA